MISYSINFEPESIVDLDALSQANRIRIIKKIAWLGDNFEEIKPIPLTGQLKGFYKLRIGDYRVIYEIESENQLIIIIRIGHRRDIYLQ